MRSSCYLASTSWNSADHIEVFLRHYRKLGLAGALVMDFNSDDETNEVLSSIEHSGFVERVRFPGIEGLDSSNIILYVAKQTLPAGSWCLFCDPDELLVTPSMNYGDLLPRNDATEIVSMPRFNVSAPLSIARDANPRISAVDALSLRIDGRHQRLIQEDIARDVLSPPWIYTAIPGKVMVKLDSAVSIGDGDHYATSCNGSLSAAGEGTYLLHYPFRTWPAFRRKIEMAQHFYSLNPQYTEHHGWQLKRWIRIARAGNLYQDYLHQFVPDEQIEDLIMRGDLVRDEAIARFHRGETP